MIQHCHLQTQGDKARWSCVPPGSPWHPGKLLRVSSCWTQYQTVFKNRLYFMAFSEPLPIVLARRFVFRKDWLWLCEKEATLTERLENIKKERQKAIVKNIGTKCGFMEACGKDTISVSLLFLQIWKEGIPLLYVYCVSFTLCCKMFILITADWCRTGITRGPDRTQQHKAFSADNCILML